MEAKVKINQINNPENGVKGIVIVFFGDRFKVRSIAVMEGKEVKSNMSFFRIKKKLGRKSHSLKRKLHRVRRRKKR